ncbi:MAG: ABC transporter permease [Gemmatimonadaceae bacterium]
MLNDLASSFATAARSIRRRPAFFAVSTATLGIALGFATTILGVVDTVRHPPMPFDDPDRTFEVHVLGGGDPVHPGPTADERIAMIGQLPAVEAITAPKRQLQPRFIYIGDRAAFDPRSGGGGTVAVPPGYFRVLGVHPRLGRTFAPDEASHGNSVIVSDDFWRKWFQDRSTIGRAELTVDDQVYTVVGVMPAGMHEPQWLAADVWLPLAPGDTGYSWFPTVRLRSGTTRAALEAQLTALTQRLTTTYQASAARKYVFKLLPFRREPASLGGFYLALTAIALCILTIASANITTLMLARAVARRRDLALRLSLGAGTRTLVFDQLAEGTLLAVGGGIAGVVFAFWGIGGVTHFFAGDVSWLTALAPHWSWRFFGISLGATAAVALLTGYLPAWQVAHIQPMEPLKESSGGSTGRSARRVQVLVAAELAVSLSLLMATALFARSTLNLDEFHFGYDASKVLSVTGRLVYRWDVQKLGTDDPVTVTLPRVEAVDGIEGASWLAVGHPDRSQVFSDRTVGIAPLLAGDYYITGPRFMQTMGIPLLAGRDFEPGDDVRGAVILDERAVAKLFPDGKAIGRRVRLGADDGGAPWLEVIGVTRAADLYLPQFLDVGVRWPPIYATVGDHDKRQWQVVARVSGNAPAVALRVSRALNTVLPGSASAFVTVFSSRYDEFMHQNRSLMRAFLSIGFASLALAAAGLFAVMSYTVNQRMREFAVRVAIGAQRGHLWRLVVRDAATMALGGTALGAFGGFFAGSLLGGGLYGVNPTDVISLMLAELVLLGVAFGTCVVPALRAGRADPVGILRAT